MDKLARDRAVEWIIGNPGRFALLVPLKILRFWLPDGESEWFYQRGFAAYDKYMILFRAVRILNQAYYFLLATLALPTVWRLLQRRALNATPWAQSGVVLFGFFTLVAVVFSGQSRHHFALMPYVAIYAAWTLLPSLKAIGDGATSNPKGVQPRADQASIGRYEAEL
jgi:hypothetical protein